MQVAKLGLFSLFICASCLSKNLLDKSSIGGNYKIEKHKLKDNRSIIAGQFFHLESESKSFFAYMNVNGIIHYTDSGRFSFMVLPGSYKIQGSYVGKKWVVTKRINLERGDSIFLKLYLIDDDRPLYEK